MHIPLMMVGPKLHENLVLNGTGRSVYGPPVECIQSLCTNGKRASSTHAKGTIRLRNEPKVIGQLSRDDTGFIGPKVHGIWQVRVPTDHEIDDSIMAGNPALYRINPDVRANDHPWKDLHAHQKILADGL
jgi:hypothetical protein